MIGSLTSGPIFVTESLKVICEPPYVLPESCHSSEQLHQRSLVALHGGITLKDSNSSKMEDCCVAVLHEGPKKGPAFCNVHPRKLQRVSNFVPRLAQFNNVVLPARRGKRQDNRPSEVVRDGSIRISLGSAALDYHPVLSKFEATKVSVASLLVSIRPPSLANCQVRRRDRQDCCNQRLEVLHPKMPRILSAAEDGNNGHSRRRDQNGTVPDACAKIVHNSSPQPFNRCAGHTDPFPSDLERYLS